MDNTEKIVKSIVRIVSTIGTGLIISNAIRSTTPQGTGKLMQFCIYMGGMAISAIIGDKVGAYTDEGVEKAFKAFNGFKNA